jgi:hypothetical protein
MITVVRWDDEEAITHDRLRMCDDVTVLYGVINLEDRRRRCPAVRI